MACWFGGLFQPLEGTRNQSIVDLQEFFTSLLTAMSLSSLFVGIPLKGSLDTHICGHELDDGMHSCGTAFSMSVPRLLSVPMPINVATKHRSI